MFVLVIRKFEYQYFYGTYTIGQTCFIQATNDLHRLQYIIHF